MNHGFAQDTPLPALPTFRDAPTRSWEWYLSTAPLHDLRGLKLCDNEHEGSYSCAGVLLFYRDDSQDALGQIFWDRLISAREISQEKARYRNVKVGTTHYVEWKVATPDLENASDNGGDGWNSLAQSGTIRWWSGRLGNRIVVDPTNLA